MPDDNRPLKNAYLLAEQVSSDLHEYWSLNDLKAAREILTCRIEELHTEGINSTDTHPTGVFMHSLKLLYEALWKINHQHHGISVRSFSRRKPVA